VKHQAAFLSTREDWETPQAFFNVLNERFWFTLDACATEENAKCGEYYSPEDDALTKDWPGVVWCNPPYSHGIGAWVRKAYHEASHGSLVVMLIPARTDTAWWHDYVMAASEVVLIRGRMRFGGATVNAPFPSALVIFGPGADPDRDCPTFSTMDRILDEEST
jgi:phage N-6-adenine-methyltransferase